MWCICQGEKPMNHRRVNTEMFPLLQGVRNATTTSILLVWASPTAPPNFRKHAKHARFPFAGTHQGGGVFFGRSGAPERQNTGSAPGVVFPVGVSNRCASVYG